MMDKTIKRVTNPEEQERETFRYWQSIPPGDRLSAVCQLSMEAYSFAGMRFDGPRPPRTLVRAQRS